MTQESVVIETSEKAADVLYEDPKAVVAWLRAQGERLSDGSSPAFALAAAVKDKWGDDVTTGYLELAKVIKVAL